MEYTIYNLQYRPLRKKLVCSSPIREAFKYYFADFVRKGGGGGTPQIRNPLFAENFFRKGGEGGTPQIRNLFFFTKNRCFWAKNTIFRHFWAKKYP